MFISSLIVIAFAELAISLCYYAKLTTPITCRVSSVMVMPADGEHLSWNGRVSFEGIFSQILSVLLYDQKGNDLVKKHTFNVVFPLCNVLFWSFSSRFKITKKKQQENNTGFIRKTLRSQQTIQNKNSIPLITIKKKTVSSDTLALPSKSSTTGTNGVQRAVDKNVAKLTHTNSSRISDEFDETSLYISAIDMWVDFVKVFFYTFFCRSDVYFLMIYRSCESKRSNDLCNKSEKEPSLSRDINLLAISDKSIVTKKDAPPTVPEGVDDFDKDNWNDPFQVSNYAMHIFDYLKSREVSRCFDLYSLWIILSDFVMFFLVFSVPILDQRLFTDTTEPDKLDAIPPHRLDGRSSREFRIKPRNIVLGRKISGLVPVQTDYEKRRIATFRIRFAFHRS